MVLLHSVWNNYQPTLNIQKGSQQMIESTGN
ncbi:hypothetical protein SYNPCC7002_A2237 [Picosynechococcus sp. PCC 7002]|nr:hypothetical protein SYNPCC7002_A2237 [Picosynechococcus sp. PCC 7002]